MSDVTYTIKPVSFAVFIEGRDFIDESCVTVTVDDEGAGPFVRLSSTSEQETTNGQISMDFDCLEAIVEAARSLKEHHG